MQAEIITIGDELLIGQTVDTNSAWIGEQLNMLGIRVHRKTAISDNRDEIVAALDEALSRSSLVLVTGGLGPTRDDITKKTLCEYFGSELVMDQVSLERIESYFRGRGLAMLEVNRQQALVPDNCYVVHNLRGTANGMWFERDGKVVVSMPGVPYEMTGMMEDEILEKIQEFFRRPAIIHRTVLTVGVGESFLAEKIRTWEDSLAADDIHLAYLPSPGMVKLRLSIYGGADRALLVQRVEKKKEELLTLIGDYVFGFDKDTLAGVVGELLRQSGASLSVAESCTGGYLGHLITGVAGSSDYFVGGVIAYTNTIKDHQLGVSHELLESAGAVNEATAIQMAQGARSKLQTTWALSTTGVAGPGGGTEEDPVGTIWIAVAGPDRAVARRFRFGKSRDRNILMAANSALNLLRKEILGQGI